MNLKKKNIMWIGKTGDANAWYHIYPFSQSNFTNELHLVRYKKPLRESPNTINHIFNGTGSPLDLIRILFKGMQVLYRYKIDCIITFNPVPWGFLAWILSKLFRKPIMVGYIGTDFHYYLQKRPYKYLLNFMNRTSKVIFVPGNKMKKKLLEKSYMENKVNIFPHCVDNNWFDSESKEKPIYHAITVSSLLKGKRIDDIIKAVEIIKVKNKSIRVCILGDGKEFGYLRNMIYSKGLTSYIDLVGFQKDVKSFLSKSKIYIQASENEGLSLSIIEAMSVGLVPVTTLAGSEDDHIVDNENGLFFKIGNYKQLAEKIKILIDNDNEYLRIKGNVLKYRSHFSADNAISFCDNIIKKYLM